MCIPALIIHYTVVAVIIVIHSHMHVHVEFIGDQHDTTDSRQDSSPSPVSSYEPRPTSTTSLLGRKSSAEMHDKPSAADIFKTQSLYSRLDAQSAKSRKEPTPTDQPSISSQSVVSIEEATGEKIMETAADITSVEHQPYIPLQTAQQALAKVIKKPEVLSVNIHSLSLKVVDDMHKMKAKHIRIVDGIETAYKDIEDESKVENCNDNSKLVSCIPCFFSPLVLASIQELYPEVEKTAWIENVCLQASCKATPG